MTLEGKRFNDGVIDLSSLRKKKEEEEAKAKAEVVFDAEAVMDTIPQSFAATGEDGADVTLTVQSAMVFPEGDIFLILTDNIPGEPFFLMVSKHENNAMVDGLVPPTEEQFNKYQEIITEYQQEQEAMAVEDAKRDAYNEEPIN